MRQLKEIASDTAELKLHCERAASLLQTSADVVPEIEALERTVVELQDRMTHLSTDLGGDVGKGGLAIADKFQTFMHARAGLLSEARERLEANRPEDRVAAAQYLTRAAVLARDAHEALVPFINDHSPRK